MPRRRPMSCSRIGRVCHVVRNATIGALGSATLIAFSVVATRPASHADATLHEVQYTVTADQQVSAAIYYRDVEPPNWADYSHNSYIYSPKAEADIGPGRRWAHAARLSDPGQWAMVAVTISGLSSAAPMFHCELAVDGVVVDANDGPNGALCSMRTW